VAASVAEVLGVGDNAVGGSKLVAARLANRSRGAGGQVVGKLGIAGAHAVGAGTTLTVEGATGLIFGALLARRAGNGVGHGVGCQRQKNS